MTDLKKSISNSLVPPEFIRQSSFIFSNNLVTKFLVIV
jgi:hypothetical protein